MPMNNEDKQRYRGPVTSRSIADLGEVELAAYKMEARNVATRILDQYKSKPEFMAVVSKYLEGLAMEMVNDDLNNNNKKRY